MTLCITTYVFNFMNQPINIFYFVIFSSSGKSGSDDLFDKLDTSKLNAHLKELMPGLTAKVFRTYNASITLDEMVRWIWYLCVPYNLQRPLKIYIWPIFNDSIQYGPLLTWNHTLLQFFNYSSLLHYHTSGNDGSYFRGVL